MYLHSTSPLLLCLPWLPIVYYICHPSLPPVLPSLLYTATLLYLLSLHYNSLFILLSLCYQLSLPILLSALFTHSCIPCLVYIAIQSAMPKLSSEFPIAFYAHLVSFSNVRSRLSLIEGMAQNYRIKDPIYMGDELYEKDEGYM